MSVPAKPFESVAPRRPLARQPLDALRGAAALTVFVAHAGVFWLDAWSTLLPGILLHAADLAVIVFFVISGYVIVMSMCRRAAASDDGRLDVKRFARDRAQRLLPPLFAALLLTTVCDAVLLSLGPSGYEPYWSARLALGVALFLQGLVAAFEVPLANGPLWSLAHEGWYYVAGVALFARQRRVLLLVGLLVLACGAIATLGGWPDAFMGDMAARWLPGFIVWCAGGTLAWLGWRGCLPGLSGRSRRVATICLMALLIGLACLPQPWARYPFGFVLAVLLGVSLAVPRPVDTCAGTARWLIPLAAVAPFAYTLYVFHYPLVLVWNVVSDDWQGSGVGLFLSMLMGAAGIVGFCAVTGHRLERGARR